MKLSRKVSAASLAVAITYGSLSVATATAATNEKDGATATPGVALQKCNGTCSGKCSSSAKID